MITALYPGKFKPPHRGHFEVAKQLLNKVDRVQILISSSPKNDITSFQSKQIWNIYNELLNNRLEIQITDISPVKYVLNTIKNNPNIQYVAVFGKGESNRFKTIINKPNVQIIDAGNIDNINSTLFRKHLQINENIDIFLPTGINQDQISSVLNNYNIY